MIAGNSHSRHGRFIPCVGPRPPAVLLSIPHMGTAHSTGELDGGNDTGMQQQQIRGFAALNSVYPKRNPAQFTVAFCMRLAAPNNWHARAADI